jgi:hypothetical protein
METAPQQDRMEDHVGGEQRTTRKCARNRILSEKWKKSQKSFGRRISSPKGATVNSQAA